MDTITKTINTFTGNTILFVLTSADQFTSGPAKGKKTGYYLPELAHPYYAIRKAGYSIAFASPKGGESPLDQSSVDAFKDDEECIAFLHDKEAQSMVKNTVPIIDIQHTSYAAVFYVGGHGPVFDLTDDVNSIELITKFIQAGKAVSAVCHGTTVFLNVNIDETPYVKGKKLTCFTNEEEEQAGLTSSMPFLVESELRAKGAIFEAGAAWSENVVVDGKLITGQNPQSAKKTAEELLRVI